MNTRITTFVIALALVLTSHGIAGARHNNGLEGLLLGSAGGAIFGHAIDRSPEGIIVGSMIGGTLGLLIDIGSSRDRVVVFDSRHHQQVRYLSNRHRNHRNERCDHRKHRRHEQRWHQERRHYRR